MKTRVILSTSAFVFALVAAMATNESHSTQSLLTTVYGRSNLTGQCIAVSGTIETNCGPTPGGPQCHVYLPATGEIVLAWRNSGCSLGLYSQ